MKNKVKIIIAGITIFVIVLLMIFSSKNSKTKKVYKKWLKSNQNKITVIKKDIEKKKETSVTIKEDIKESEKKVKKAKESKPDIVDNPNDARKVIDDFINRSY